MKSLVQKVTAIASLIAFSSVNIFGEDEFFEPKSTLGGYGELHYNSVKKDGADEYSETMDFHRFIIFYSHAWTEKWSFKSEVELEHNFVKDGHGELELEQAFVNYRANYFINIAAGVVLPSVGLINTHHEPPLFLSVERPDYAKYIIPTTWFGNGISVGGIASGVDYKLTIMESLNGAGFSNKDGIRGGRAKGYKSEGDIEHLVYNLHIGYTGIPDLRLGGDYVFNNAPTTDSTADIAVNLVALYAKYNAHNVMAVAEFGNVSYGTGALEQSMGYYFDIGYNVLGFTKCKSKLYPWFRWSDYNTASAVNGGGDAEKEHHYTTWRIGLTYYPINQVVVKTDFGMKSNQLSDKTDNQFNLGAGYMF